MKQVGRLPFLVLGCSLVLAFSSCCTKMKCSGIEAIGMITFCGFDTTDLDTIVVFSYPRDSGFDSPLDSIVTGGVLSGSCHSAYLFAPLNTERDYLIKAPIIGEEYRLSGYEIKRLTCNQCFPITPEGQVYEDLSAYTINGQRQVGREITIYR